MIVASYGEGVLRVSGHASSDPRCCAAVGMLMWTLHTSYGAPEPTEGSFEWNMAGPVSTTKLMALGFALNALRNLAESYPDEVSFTDDADRFSS